ncbi:protease inhibitor I42 family protein [Candidatus Bipolaricaulota bacterium]|nr:protease inhibitor I42 family protein [Candidatus Bipolaricaulota bacterium]
MQRKIAYLLVLCLAMAFLLGPAALAFEQNLVGTEFRSNGDPISGWYWLRDEAFQQFAEWTFEDIPAGSLDLRLEITALATDRAGGGRGFPAEFRLIYGFPGSGMMGGVFETKMVTLPNVSLSDDQLGYTCRSVVTISRSAFPAASSLVFKVERTSPDANHVAFNKGSLVILAPTAEAEALRLKVASPSGFASTGDVTLGTAWCRRPAHTLEWTWEPLSEGGSILEAAVNLNLLVTNTIDGGSGFSAVVPVAVFDLSGKVVESGLVELVNTFKPQFTGDSGGIGYAASGAYELKDPEIILDGFKLRLAWPAIAPQGAENEPTGTTRHFGGSEKSALLAYIATSSGEGTETPLQTTVYDILSNPLAYEGKTVRLEAQFYGWAGKLVDCPPPVSRSDWIIGADGWYIYVTGPAPEGLSPWNTEDYWKPLLLEGTVRTKLEPPARACPYLEVQSVEVLEETATRVLDEDDNGRTITMDVGNTLIVRLWGNPTTGYLWECTQPLTEGILQPVGEVEFQSEPAPSGMVGVSGVFTFRFQIIASGTVPLQLVYHRPWEEEAIETFSVTIVVGGQEKLGS